MLRKPKEPKVKSSPLHDITQLRVFARQESPFLTGKFYVWKKKVIDHIHRWKRCSSERLKKKNQHKSLSPPPPTPTPKSCDVLSHHHRYNYGCKQPCLAHYLHLQVTIRKGGWDSTVAVQKGISSTPCSNSTCLDWRAQRKNSESGGEGLVFKQVQLCF